MLELGLRMRVCRLPEKQKGMFVCRFLGFMKI